MTEDSHREPPLSEEQATGPCVPGPAFETWVPADSNVVTPPPSEGIEPEDRVRLGDSEGDLRFSPLEELPQSALLPRPTLPSARIPNLGHALLFLSFAFLVLLFTQLALLPHGANPTAIPPRRALAAMAITYLGALGFCFLVFPPLWHRSFPSGIQWNRPQAQRLLLRLIPFGMVLSFAIQALSSLLPTPKSIPMDDFFGSTTDVWIVSGFGVLLAPLVEEVCFRGFLLPAFTIAFDWLGGLLAYLLQFSTARLSGEEPRRHFAFFLETRSAGLSLSGGNLAFRSPLAIGLASIVTSVLFALLHAAQLGYTWSAVAVLFCVSLILTAVRIKTRSVACSTLVHASYNFTIFLVMFLATGGYRHLDKIH